MSTTPIIATPQRAAPDRTDQILGACKAAFAQKGFDGASMQDLAKSAGMSAGNFYRYFPSKDSIVEAIVARDLAEIEGLFEMIVGSPTPRTTFLHVLAAKMEHHAADEDGALWAEIEAAANRRPEIGRIMAQMESAVIAYQLRLFAKMAGVDEPTAQARYHAHARVILMMVRASAMSACQAATPTSDQEERAFRALVLQNINLMLNDITSADRTPS